MEEQKTKGFQKKQMIILGIVVAVIICAVVVIVSLVSNADEKLAAKLLSEAALEFKDPSSVRMVSGELDTEDTSFYVTISAKNGFGATGTGIYKISFTESGTFVIMFEGNSLLDDGDFDNTTDLDIAKVNKILKRLLSKYE